MIAPLRLRIEKDTVTKIHRNLPGKGKILANLGQEVTPEQIIGTSEYSSGFSSLHLASLMGVSGADSGKFLKVKLGSRIYKGELLAYKSGWLLQRPKVIISPIDGVIDYIDKNTGEIRITRLPRKIDLPAGVYGVVEEVNHKDGRVTIRTLASKVYGMCGSGKTRDGILYILTRRDSLTGNSMITRNFGGGVLVNGSLISKDSLINSISNGVNGIITGGINAADYKSIAGGRLLFPKKLENDIGLSIVVCEGFGSQPLGEDVYEVLSKYEGRFVTIDGNKAEVELPSYESSCMLKIRKLKVTQKDFVSKQETTSSFTELKMGQMVRVVGSSFASEQGRVLAIDRTKTILGSGIYATLLTLETKRRKIRIPASNVEVIG